MSALWLWFCLFLYNSHISAEYSILGVSGGLQNGFPDSDKMMFRSVDEQVPAIFLGEALVRGVKSYLDIMQKGWRQYVEDPGQPLVNSNVFVTSCFDHANLYHIYAVDERQFLHILNNEPRFLSITPDTALVDLESNLTDPVVRQLALREIDYQGMKNREQVAIPIVVAVWYHESHVPSPPIHVLEDGTHVTEFARSLAMWADVNDGDRTAGCVLQRSDTCQSTKEDIVAQQRYWKSIRTAVRNAETQSFDGATWRAQGPPFNCQQQVRLGVDKETARINYRIGKDRLVSLLEGHDVDFATGIVS